MTHSVSRIRPAAFVLSAFFLAFPLMGGAADAVDETADAEQPIVVKGKAIRSTSDMSSGHPQIPEGTECSTCHHVSSDVVSVPGPPLSSDQVMSDKHMTYSRGMTCAECHDVTFDIATTATRQFINNFPQLRQDEIWQKIEEFLPGRERFALASVYKGEPTATTIDLVLDREEKMFAAVSEKGTEKLLHFPENPNVSAVRFAGWTVAEGGKKIWRSVQIKGVVELVPPEDPRFVPYLERYQLVRVTKDRAKRRFNIVRIKPTQIVYFDTGLGAQDLSVYQLWTRGAD